MTVHYNLDGLRRGNTYERLFRFKDGAGDPVDLTGSQIVFIAETATSILRKTTADNALQMPSPSTGEVTLKLTPEETRLIDQTSGVEVADASSIDIKTIRPAVTIRAADLASEGFDAIDLEGAQLVLGDRAWRVKATMPKPAPTGEAEGELFLYLIEDTA